ncbi:MAG TPA: hypothetical protein DCL41_08585 [Bdellovibrionales bacterium]|nr:hypothetical protein [Pseudobdellovibrionaceae bacterium]HAG91914.1 hypothetical protein [Bdellovibrionales bacterium]|tara:strand:- start:14263 stop:14445 length:183 start_codon:yes stop_codon:yes gene_type:complete
MFHKLSFKLKARPTLGPRQVQFLLGFYEGMALVTPVFPDLVYAPAPSLIESTKDFTIRTK